MIANHKKIFFAYGDLYPKGHWRLQKVTFMFVEIKIGKSNQGDNHNQIHVMKYTVNMDER